MMTAEPLQNGLAACQMGTLPVLVTGVGRHLCMWKSMSLGAESETPYTSMGLELRESRKGGVADLVACPRGGFRRDLGISGRYPAC